jgi:hypothetical protein
VTGTPAIEAKDELVEVGLEVLGAQAVVDAQSQVLRLEKTRWTQGRTTWAAMAPMIWGSWVISGVPG